MSSIWLRFHPKTTIFEGIIHLALDGIFIPSQMVFEADGTQKSWAFSFENASLIGNNLI